jgi:hypothetical protein
MVSDKSFRDAMKEPFQDVWNWFREKFSRENIKNIITVIGYLVWVFGPIVLAVRFVNFLGVIVGIIWLIYWGIVSLEWDGKTF